MRVGDDRIDTGNIPSNERTSGNLVGSPTSEKIKLGGRYIPCYAAWTSYIVR